MTKSIPKFNAGVAGDENLFRGTRQTDLIGSDRYDMLCLATNTPTLSDEQKRALDVVSVAVTVADPRIWPLTLTRVSANYGNPGTALGVSILAVDDSPLGPRGFQTAAQFLAEFDMKDALPDPVPGFSVYGRTHDERIDLLEATLVEHQGDFIAKYRELCNLVEPSPHISVAVAALLLDFGLTPAQIFYFATDAYMMSFYATIVDSQTYGFADELHEIPTPE